MTLTEMAEVAVPRIDYERDARPVVCSNCLLPSDAVALGEQGFFCAGCQTRICVMCGCTDNHACEGGCYWISPGICSSHEEELQQLAVEVFRKL